MSSRNNTSKIVARILDVAAKTGFIAVSFTAPGIAKWFGKDFLKYLDNLEQRNELKRILSYMKRKRLVEINEEIGGSYSLKITEAGKKQLKRYQFDELKIPDAKNWDRKWRIVIFDIPENKKLARDALAVKLKQLGFYSLQKSVFVHPFSCRDEIDLIKTVYEISPFVTYIEADEIDSHNKLVKHFSNILP